uniref:cleft lip and palate transmembrane protein 1 homolog n=1 Tax=Lonchura striata TaxID=40157 RepID=UPI000B4C8FFF|nr:cleft lip and palate transmembrane protein 1 homolog [Lonchura striata domestica]XP_021385579.1 cleft lip and palate transmembrane protein 1 homolog [Lonchura striata domestica]
MDLWKITKVMDVRLDRERRLAGIFPRPRFADKSTYVESSTKVYDDVSAGIPGMGHGIPGMWTWIREKHTQNSREWPQTQNSQ